MRILWDDPFWFAVGTAVIAVGITAILCSLTVVLTVAACYLVLLTLLWHWRRRDYT